MPLRARRSWSLSLALALACGASPARAGAPSDVAVAEALFREGRALVADGKLAEGCAKLAESQRLDPAPGTILNLGDCFERRGLFASAWGAYVESVDQAKRAGKLDQAEIAAARARDVEAKVPYLVVRVSAAVDVPGLTVTDNGAPVPRGQWGSALPVDPGEHTLAVAAPGRTTATKIVQIAPIANDAEPASTAARTTTFEAPTLVAVAPPQNLARPPAEGPAWSTQKSAGAITFGVGAAALVAGTAFGILALARDGDARDAGCDDHVCTTERGRALTVDARHLATASTWLFVGGALVTVAGATLFITAPSARADGPSTAMAGVRGRW